MITLAQYAVRAGDTIQDIARAQLGDVSRWTDIAALNKLRRPYISDNLPDQLGPMLGQLTLQPGMSLAAGATQIANWDANATGYANSPPLLQVGNILVFAVPQSNGTTLYDAAQISAVTQNINATTSHLILTVSLTPISGYRSLAGTLLGAVGGLKVSHAAGDTFSVYGNPTALRTGVAQAGDLLALPIPATDQQGGANALLTRSSDLIAALGTDVALDYRGQETVGPNGDVQTVSGVPNVKQALITRIKTRPGERQDDPTYGCDIWFYLGANQIPGWPKLALALISDCILQDSRVHDVTSLAFSQSGDADYVEFGVTVAQGGQLLTNTVPITP